MLSKKAIIYIIIGSAILVLAVFFYLSRGSEAGLGVNADKVNLQDHKSLYDFK